MRLTENMIIARSKQSDLSTIKRINLWGCDLTDVSVLKQMINVEVLALSINNLSSLQPLEACMKLQMLYLRKNNISDFSELKYLQNLPALTELWLAENPCAIHAGPNYRATVLKMLPKLKKLDDEEVTAADIEESLRFSNAKMASECFPHNVCMEEKQSPKREPESVDSPKTEKTSPVQELIKAESLPINNIANLLQQRNQTSYAIKQQQPEETSATQPEPLTKFQVTQEFETQRSRHSLPLSFAPRAAEQPKDAHMLSKTQSLNQIPQLKLVLQIHPTQGPLEQPLNIEFSDQEQLRTRCDGSSDRIGIVNRNGNLLRLEQGSLTSRTRVSQGLQQDSGWDSISNSNREMSSHKFQRTFPSLDGSQTSRSTSTNDNSSWEDGFQTSRTNVTSRMSATASTQYSSKSSQRNANVLSALLCIVPELDVESLQVLEHSIQCRLDEICDQ